MANSENAKQKAAERSEKLDEKYENAVAAAEDKLGKHTEKITELGRRLTGKAHDSDR